MSYQNFKAKIWAKAIDRDLERKTVFADDTNKEYSGQIKALGDTVRIMNVAAPTVTTQILKDGNIKLEDPEHVSDQSVSLVVDYLSTFNYVVGDIDAAQGAGKVLAVLNEQVSEKVAGEIDKAIADLSLGTVGINKYDKANTVINKDNILDVLDSMQTKLFEKDVATTTEISVTMPPWMFKVLKQAFVQLDTDNSNMMENGKVAKYSNMTIKMSNNVARDKNGHYYVQAKTKRAIALAKSENHTEAYRPEKGFADAVKGFCMFGCKVVRPAEMITLECSPE